MNVKQLEIIVISINQSGKNFKSRRNKYMQKPDRKKIMQPVI